MKAVLFGSIGVLAETSELQRRAYNAAFDALGIDLHWNIATYCAHINIVGGKTRLASVLPDTISASLVTEIHEVKQTIFQQYLAEADIKPRAGIRETLRYCKDAGLKTGFITTTTQRQLDGIFSALSDHLNPSDFDIITRKSDVLAEKPASDIYTHALSLLDLSAKDVVAIEDTEMNQKAAHTAGIDCYLLAGDYATIQHGRNQIFSAEQLFDSANSAKLAVSRGAA